MKELQERIAQLSTTSGAQCPVCGKPLEQHERETLILELNQNGRAMGDAFRKNSAFIEECEKRFREIDLELQNLQRADAALKLPAAAPGWQKD